VLVAWRPDERGTYGIHRFDPATGAREPVFAERGWHALQARVLAPRQAPDGRSSVVRDDDTQGTLFTVDVGITDRAEALPPGAAKTLRVIEGLAATADRPAQMRLLGEIPLAPDGSYQVRIPANTPVRLQLVDAGGAALRTSAWLWVRNHAAQGCVGCHEDPERTPPNRLMQALESPAPVLDPPAQQRRVLSASDVSTRCAACHGASGGR
jgi:hypothetical protein